MLRKAVLRTCASGRAEAALKCRQNRIQFKWFGYLAEHTELLYLLRNLRRARHDNDRDQLGAASRLPATHEEFTIAWDAEIKQDRRWWIALQSSQRRISVGHCRGAPAFIC